MKINKDKGNCKQKNKDKGKDKCKGKGKDKDKKINIIQGRLQKRGQKAMTKTKKQKDGLKKITTRTWTCMIVREIKGPACQFFKI